VAAGTRQPVHLALRVPRDPGPAGTSGAGQSARVLRLLVRRAVAGAVRHHTRCRDAYAAAYASDESLRAGFAWYRQLPADAAANAAASEACGTPPLYLRGEHERGELSDYVDGFVGAGLTRASAAVVGGAGHFAPEDNPAEVWTCVREFTERTPR